MTTSEFSQAELLRYSRHFSLDGVGTAGQLRLKQAKVLVIGAGGLGSPLLLYLAAAGVGTIGIVEFDCIEESNLHRQVLYSSADIGRRKIDVARQRLVEINPHVNVQTHPVRLTSDNALEILKPYDIVADGTDNFPTRYLVNDACVILGKPNVYASILRFEGQAAVFNYRDSNGHHGPNYRDLFPTPPLPGLVPSCAEAGVFGSLAGIMGSIQANEVIKLILGIETVLNGRLFLFDSRQFSSQTVKIKRADPPYIIDGLIDYEEFCTEKTKEDTPMMKSITVDQLAQMRSNDEPHQLIDVRETYEYEFVNLDGDLFPMGEIDQHVPKIATDKMVIVMCRSGKRSADTITHLQSKYGFENLYNLDGGILAYADHIDPQLPKY